MMPGKDCISIRVNGEKEHVQKWLLLSSIREAYQQFQVDHPGVKIGLTKFVELRPKNVVLAGASGTHNGWGQWHSQWLGPVALTMAGASGTHNG